MRTQFWPPIDPRQAAERGEELWDIGPNMLYVSNLGRVAKNRQGDLLKQKPVNGYPTVSVSEKDGGRFKRVRLYVHQLVLITFEGPQQGCRARCLNGKTDVRLCSLVWQPRNMISSAQKERLDLLLREGRTQAEISKLMGLERSTVQYYAQRSRSPLATPLPSTLG